jgi:hypothetical protein
VSNFPGIWHPEYNLEKIEGKFNITKNDPGNFIYRLSLDYEQFRKKVKVVGIYDDHDYN